MAWTEASVASEWVIEEAEVGKKKNILIPLFLESVEPPLGFGAFQALDLSGWDGKIESQVFEQLVQDMERVLGSRPTATAKKRARNSRTMERERQGRRQKRVSARKSARSAEMGSART